MRKLTGSQIIISLLKQNGIGTVSGIPGGSILPLYDELARSGIRHVLVRQEQAAGFIAQGMARVTGKASVCMATSGPGAMNLLTAIADARSDSVPLVAITGQVNLSLIGTDAFQEADTFGLSFPITKHSVMVKSAAELVRAVPLAFAIAESGRPGPVLIDVPRNVQAELAEVPGDFDSCFNRIYAEFLASGKGIRFRTPDEKIPAVVENFAVSLISSKRPVLFLGGGANSPVAASQVRRLLETYPMPVVSSLMGLGIVPAADEKFLGMVGMHGSYCANRAMFDSDLVLSAGARFDDRATGVVEKFCPNARILHIDIDAAEINKILQSDSFLVEDSAKALEALNATLEKIGPETRKIRELSGERESWLRKCVSLKEGEKVSLKMDCGTSECCGNRACGVKSGESFRNPREFIKNIPSVAQKFGIGGEDIIVTTDVGQHQMWTAQFYPVSRARQLLTSGSLGTMGFGLPAAIGAALALPGKRVVCFSGDGSIMMNIQELATLSELSLNVAVIVLDNGCLGMVRQQQEYLFDKNYSASTFQSRPDLVKIAQGFGIRAFDADLDGNWAEGAFAEGGPCLVRVKISRFENVLPFVKAGQANIDALR